MPKRTALQLCQQAYREANMSEALSTLSPNQCFPYNIAMDCLNDVLRDLNRMGSFWFMETKTPLVYSVGVHEYNLMSLGIDPLRISQVRDNQGAQLGQMHERNFSKRFRTGVLNTARPTVFSKFANTLSLNVIPDEDYGLVAVHYDDIPLVIGDGDFVAVPEEDEDIVVKGILASILMKMDRSASVPEYTLFKKLAEGWLVEVKQDFGLPAVRPRLF